MKLFLAFFLVVLNIFAIYAQDTIIKKNGEKITCKVIDEDSSQVNFLLYKNNRQITTFLLRDQIAEIHYLPQQIIDSIAEVNSRNRKTQRLSIGVGAGLDYGGLGLNMTIYPKEQIGVFGSLGYNLIGYGFNVGVKLREINRKKSQVVPFFIGMFGYNTVIIVDKRSDLNKTFYGPSLGAGMECFFSRRKNTSFVLALLIPVRWSEVDDYIKEQKISLTQANNKLLPVAISVGFNF